MRTDTEKIKRLQNSRAQTTFREMRSYVEISSYYRRFIKGPAGIARPLREKTSANVNFSWNDEMQRAFEAIKSALCNPSALTYPDPSKLSLVAANTYSKSICAVLMQIDGNNRDHTIQYAS